MSTIDGCYRDIQLYNELANNLHTIVGHLENSYTKCNHIKSELSTKYLVDDNTTPVFDKASSLYDDIYETSNYLKNVVIPEITNSINGLKREIVRLEAEEAKRRSREAAKKNKKTVPKTKVNLR